VLNQSNINTDQNADLVWRKLTLSINHSHQDLKLLTKRVLFCLDNNLSEFAAGALQDLFIVLQNSGIDLRLRMLNLINPLLDYSERKYFQKKIDAENESSLTSPQECQHFMGSVLAEGDCKLNESDYLPRDPKFQNKQLEAQYLIACGKLFAAKELLEASFLNNRADTAIENELQSFYYYAKDKQGLEQFVTTLSQKNIEVSKSWQVLRKAME